MSVSNLLALQDLCEEQFAVSVETLASDPTQRGALTDLLREDHFVYNERSAAEVVRMRGWLYLSLARLGITDDELVYVLEELDTGTDPYLVAAAAYALRASPQPRAAFAPFVMRAISNIRYRDEPVSFNGYGEYGITGSSTTAVCELLATLTWLGPDAASVAGGVAALAAKSGGLPRKLHADVERVLAAIRQSPGPHKVAADCCELPSALQTIFSWAKQFRRGSESVEDVQFEDHQGTSLTFDEAFQGRPAIVVFFYTRCDNPLKCSLTVSKLAQVQKVLGERNLADEIQTAAITYDPDFDIPSRLESYALNRGVHLGSSHKMLRTTAGFDALRGYFGLGVNFIDAFVNRHRIEVFVLDEKGRIAASFQRLHWNVEQVIERAVLVSQERDNGHAHSTAPQPVRDRAPAGRGSMAATTLASIAVAFFPKCPVCWAAYLSVFGIAGLEQIPYSPGLQPLLVALMLFNLGCLWRRSRMTGRTAAFLLAVVGVLTLLVLRLGMGWQAAAPWGVAMTFAGSLWCVLPAKALRSGTD